MSEKKRSNTEWRALVTQCEASGMTHQEWCLANKVNYYTYCDRARRLRRIDEEGDADGPLFKAKPSRDWVEVKELDGAQSNLVTPAVPESEPRPTEPSHGEIRVKIGSFTVAVTDDFNEAAFIRVLRALGGASDVWEAARVC